MTWVIVAGDLTPLGGMDGANHALARYLSAHGDVHLVTHRAWPDLVDAPSITVHRVWRPLDRHLLGSPLLAGAGRRVWRRLQSSGARAIVNGGNCPIADVNWVHYLHAANPVVDCGSRVRRAKAAFARRRDLTAERAALRSARLVICNSRRTRDDVIERVGVDPARVHVVYYGGDPLRFGPISPEERVRARAALGQPPDRPLVGFVGALGDRRKAFDTLFDAWVEMCRGRDWDADLIVVGDGAERPMWQRRAIDAGVADRIRFVGFRPDVATILAALDGFVHPARYEAYGLSVREALSRGIPAVVTASAGVAEHYSDQLRGLLIDDPDDASEVAARLLTLRREMDRLRTAVLPLAHSLRARTWDAMAKQIVESVVQCQ